MRPLSVDQVAFGSAILLHLLLLPLGAGLKPKEPAVPEQIAIRFTAATERAEVPEAAEPMPGPPGAQRVVRQEARPQETAAPRAALQESRPPLVPAPLAEPVRPPAPLPAAPPLASQVAAQPASAQPAPAAPAVAHASARGALPAAAAQPHSPQLQAPETEGRSQKAKASMGGGAPAARLPDFLAVVKSMVENNREYPAMARQLGLQGTVMVRVSIRGDGSIAAAAVEGSSGHKALDKAALSAIRRSAPFRSPAGFGLGEVTLEIPIVYRLT